MTESNSFQLAILRGLQRPGMHVYAGRETPGERTERRRADKLRAALALPPGSRARRRIVHRLDLAAARSDRKAAA
ncbi:MULTISPECIES: hypothetical protein [Bacteria]|uniref:hypothetical protein n=1 Tax=Bacteria TaxID=2 RepID=UPI003C7E88B5